MTASPTAAVWLGCMLAVGGCEPILGADFDDKSVRSGDPSDGGLAAASTSSSGATSSSAGGGGGAGGRPVMVGGGGADCALLEPEPFLSVADATVAEALPTQNNPAAWVLYVDTTFPLNRLNALVRFEDFEIVRNAGTLVSAQMCVTRVGGLEDPGTSVSADVFELKHPWIETEVTWDQAMNGVPWDNNTGGDQSELVSTETFAYSASPRPIEVCLDVTSFVERVLAGTTVNNGFVFAAKPGAPVAVTLGAREHPTPQHRPKLEIQLCDPTP